MNNQANQPTIPTVDCSCVQVDSSFATGVGFSIADNVAMNIFHSPDLVTSETLGLARNAAAAAGGAMTRVGTDTAGELRVDFHALPLAALAGFDRGLEWIASIVLGRVMTACRVDADKRKASKDAAADEARRYDQHCCTGCGQRVCDCEDGKLGI